MNITEKIDMFLNEDEAKFKMKKTTTEIKLPKEIYRASLGINPKMWKSWYTANGFSFCEKTNGLKDRFGRIWFVSGRNETIEVRQN